MARLWRSVLLSIPFGIILVGNIAWTWTGIATGTVSMLLAILIHFLVMFCIGIAAFWLEDVTPIYWIFAKGIFTFGGVIMPLALMSEELRKVAERLPFSQTNGRPSELFVHPSSSLIASTFATQMIWFAVFFALAFLLFRKGAKHVSANGG